MLRKLLAMDENVIPLASRAIDVGGVNWGSVVAVPQQDLSDGAWSYAALAQAELVLRQKRYVLASTVRWLTFLLWNWAVLRTWALITCR